MPFNGAKVSSTLDLNFSVGQVLVCTGVEPCREDDRSGNINPPGFYSTNEARRKNDSEINPDNVKRATVQHL